MNLYSYCLTMHWKTFLVSMSLYTMSTIFKWNFWHKLWIIESNYILDIIHAEIYLKLLNHTTQEIGPLSLNWCFDCPNSQLWSMSVQISLFQLSIQFCTNDMWKSLRINNLSNFLAWKLLLYLLLSPLQSNKIIYLETHEAADAGICFWIHFEKINEWRNLMDQAVFMDAKGWLIFQVKIQHQNQLFCIFLQNNLFRLAYFVIFTINHDFNQTISKVIKALCSELKSTKQAIKSKNRSRFFWC